MKDTTAQIADGDRLVALLVEFKYAILAFLAFVGIVGVYYLQLLPEWAGIPPWLIDFAVAFGFVSFGGWIISKRITDMLWDYDGVRLGIINTGQNPPIHDTILIPEEEWAAKKIKHAPPQKAEGSGLADYIALDLEIAEADEDMDVDKIPIVRGCDPAEMDPDEPLKDWSKVDQYYQNYIETRRKFNRARSQLHDFVQEIHRETTLKLVSQLSDNYSLNDVNLTQRTDEFSEGELEKPPEPPHWQSDDKQADEDMDVVDDGPTPESEQQQQTAQSAGDD